MNQASYQALVALLLLSSILTCRNENSGQATLWIESSDQIHFEGMIFYDTTSFFKQFDLWVAKKSINSPEKPTILFTARPDVKVTFIKQIKNSLRKHYKDIHLTYPEINNAITMFSLPPTQQERVDFSFVAPRNLFHLIVSSEGLFYRDTITEASRLQTVELISESLKFIRGNPQDSTLPELHKVSFPKVGMAYTSPKHIFIIECKEETLYGKYSMAIDIIKQNYIDLYNSHSEKYFNCPYNSLSNSNKDILHKITPITICEIYD